MNKWHVYFMESKQNKKIYVGKTSKLPEQRVKEHNNSANIWSKNNGPFELIYFEEYQCSKDADQREKFYKSGFGREIKKVIVEHIKTIKRDVVQMARTHGSEP